MVSVRFLSAALLFGQILAKSWGGLGGSVHELNTEGVVPSTSTNLWNHQARSSLSPSISAAFTISLELKQKRADTTTNSSITTTRATVTSTRATVTSIFTTTIYNATVTTTVTTSQTVTPSTTSTSPTNSTISSTTSRTASTSNIALETITITSGSSNATLTVPSIISGTPTSIVEVIIPCSTVNYTILASGSGDTRVDGKYALFASGSDTDGYPTTLTGGVSNAIQFRLSGPNCDILSTADNRVQAMVVDVDNLNGGLDVYFFKSTAAAQASNGYNWKLLSCSQNGVGRLMCKKGSSTVFEVDPNASALLSITNTIGYQLEQVELTLVPVT